MRITVPKIYINLRMGTLRFIHIKDEEELKYAIYFGFKNSTYYYTLESFSPSVGKLEFNFSNGLCVEEFIEFLISPVSNYLSLRNADIVSFTDSNINYKTYFGESKNKEIEYICHYTCI